MTTVGEKDQINAKAKRALEKSIEKWELNLLHAQRADWSAITLNCRTCALCCEFLIDYEGRMFPDQSRCVGCPVYERTGLKTCEGTPYYEVVNIMHRKFFNVHDEEALIDAISREVEFLKSLRNDLQSAR